MENNELENNEESNVEMSIPTDLNLELDSSEELESSDELKEGFKETLLEIQDEKQEEVLWQARTGLNYDSLCGAIETIIFMSDKPVPLMKIRKLIDEELPLRVIHESLSRLQGEYEDSHHGIRLQEVAEGYQFRTKATYAKFVQDLFRIHSLVLSPTALEVMALIAYKQPISRIEVEKMRGVDSSHLIRALMDKRLVKVTGRSNEMGRPTLYGTTTEFLEVFNLSNLEELPSENELELLATSDNKSISDIKSIITSAEKGKFYFDEISELDKLQEDIKSISTNTNFTQSLKVEDKKRKDEAGTAVKSAFDLLEEYIDKDIVSKNNQEALESQPFVIGDEPKSIRDLTQGPFNLPSDVEDEAFEMIDLDTGETLEAGQIEFEIDEEFENVLNAKAANSEEGESEEMALSKALDNAFEKLTGEKLEELKEFDGAELDEALSEVEVKSDELAEMTENLSKKAAELDIDLNFTQVDEE